MTYEELQERLNQPINGDENFATMYAQLVKFVYDMHIENDKLKNKVETLEYKIHTLQYDIVELKQFIKRNVEPDLRYMG